MNTSIDDSDKFRRAEIVKQAMREVMHETNGEIKTLLKEALREWLDEKYAAFGRWSVYGIMAAMLGCVAWLALIRYGWTLPK